MGQQSREGGSRGGGSSARCPCARATSSAAPCSSALPPWLMLSLQLLFALQQVDITEGIQKQVTVLWCKDCGRYLQPPKHWLRAELESKELLTFCIKKIRGLNKVRCACVCLFKCGLRCAHRLWARALSTFRGPSSCADCVLVRLSAVSCPGYRLHCLGKYS